MKIEQEFENDPCPYKVNLGIGEYKDEYGKPYVLDVVRNAQSELNNKTWADWWYNVVLNDTSEEPTDQLFDENYLPILGFPPFYEQVEEIIFFGDNKRRNTNEGEDQIFSLQTISGTGAMRLTLEFLQSFVSFKSIALSKPDYPNHRAISEEVCPDKQIIQYRYKNEGESYLDYEGMLEDLLNLPERSVVILQSGCHNPTGIDPTTEQWKGIIDVFSKRALFPILDAAYIGFSSGDVMKDVIPLRLFQQSGIEFAVCVSFSKNMGVYGERVGTLHLQTRQENIIKNITSQFEAIARRLYSSPPVNGGRIGYLVLQQQQQWFDEIKSMVDRISKMRMSLVDGLKEEADWSYILDQKGMFAMVEMSKDQITFLREQFHVYMIPNGRINIAGLNKGNIGYVTKSIILALKN